MRRWRARRQLDHLALEGGEHVERASGVCHPRAGQIHETIHRVVGAQRIVVEQRQPLGPGGHREVHHPFDGAVSPGHPLSVLLERVLRVVDHELGPGEELDVPPVLVVHLVDDAVAQARIRRVRLVIGRVHEGGAVRLEAVAERDPGVIEISGGGVDGTQLEGALAQVMVANRGAHLAERHREIGVLHLPGERLLEPPATAARRVDVPLVARDEQRREEGEALDVVPMRVADQEVAPDGARPGGDEVLAQVVRARSAVEHDQGPVGSVCLDARGIAAVAQSRGPRPGQ